MGQNKVGLFAVKKQKINLDAYWRPDIKYPAFTHKFVWYPLARLFAPFFLRINATADHVSILKFLIFVLAGVVYLGGTWEWFVLGGVLLIVAHALDYTDGLIARVTGTASEHGRQVDNITEDTGEIVVIMGLTLGLYKAYNFYPLIGLLGVAIVVFKTVLGYIGKQETQPKETVFSSPLPLRVYWTVKMVPILLLITGIFNVMVMGFVLMCAYYGIRLSLEAIRR